MDASYPEEVGARELRALDVHEVDKLIDNLASEVKLILGTVGR